MYINQRCIIPKKKKKKKKSKMYISVIDNCRERIVTCRIICCDMTLTHSLLPSFVFYLFDDPEVKKKKRWFFVIYNSISFMFTLALLKYVK